MANKIAIYFYQIPKRGKLNLSEWLSADEHSRFQKMSNEGRREEYLHSRALVKSVLKKNHGIKNPVIKINSHGKPRVPGLHFSLSHSHGFIVLAVSKNAPVGVDIERTQKSKGYKKIVESYFSPIENEFILSAKTERLHVRRFMQLWSLKEAYVKAGNGVLNKKTLSISFDPVHGRIHNAKRPVKSFFNSKHNIAVCVISNEPSTIHCFKVDKLSRFTKFNLNWKTFNN